MLCLVYVYFYLSHFCLLACLLNAVVELQIEKFGDPNGIVQFDEAALSEQVYDEPADVQGPLNISLLLRRREGVMGNITVTAPK